MIRQIADVATMENLGGQLALNCPPGLKLFLHGQLGAGKTTLVRGFLKALGHQGTVKSPTYTLVEPYHTNGRTIYHFDLYRLNSPDELDAIGLRDYFDAAAICLVEWPERGGRLLGTADLDIVLELAGTGRVADLKAQTGPARQLLTALNAAV